MSLTRNQSDVLWRRISSGLRSSRGLISVSYFDRRNWLRHRSPHFDGVALRVVSKSGGHLLMEESGRGAVYNAQSDLTLYHLTSWL